MTHNVQNWKYKTLDEVKALDVATLNAEWKNLTAAIKLFHDHNMPMTDEMWWLFVNLSSEMAIRAEKAISDPAKNTLC